MASFNLDVGTPYSRARSLSNITRCPRTEWMGGNSVFMGNEFLQLPGPTQNLMPSVLRRRANFQKAVLHDSSLC